MQVPFVPRVFAARHARVAAMVLACLAALALALSTLPQTTRAFGVALQTGLDSSPAGGHYEQVTINQIRATGAHFMRLTVNWNEIAPATAPPGFNPANPNDPAYNWSVLDSTIRTAEAAGLTPVLGVIDAPRWGQSPVGAGEESPDPVQLALFGEALAARYNGSNDGLPWVRYLEVWNEPNLSYFMKPQIENNRDVSVETYRSMINDFSEAVHGVRSDDVVIGGALFPNGLNRREVTAIAPLRFTRELFCMSAGAHPRRVCDTQVHVDAWSLHPYTSGGPSTRPANPENLWIYNMGALTKLVKAAQSAGTLVSSQPVQTWVTEFSWFSNPPNPKGVPVLLEQRWVAETLYRAWQGGFSVFAWYDLRDNPSESPPQESGLYFSCALGIECDTPKPAEQSFRFPFVAFRRSKTRALLWGRTPVGTPGRVQIQWLSGGRWRTLTTLPTDSNGIFTSTRKLPRGANPKNALFRARFNGETSPSFSLYHPPDILVTPFATA